MVTRADLLYTRDYLTPSICSLIKPTAMEKLMSIRAIIHTAIGPAAADFPRDVCLSVSHNHKVFLLYLVMLLHGTDCSHFVFSLEIRTQGLSELVLSCCQFNLTQTLLCWRCVAHVKCTPHDMRHIASNDGLYIQYNVLHCVIGVLSNYATAVM